MSIERDENDIDLDFVRGVRKDVIAKLTSKGIPEDNHQMAILQSYLNDMSRDAMGKKRLKVEKQIGDKTAEAQALIASLLLNPDVKKIGRGAGGRIPELPHDLPHVEIVEGEFSEGGQGETYAQFMERTTRKS